MNVHADLRFITDALTRLVQVNSINPAFTGGATNEVEIARVASALLEAQDVKVRRFEPEPRRTSVLGRWPGSGGGRSLLLYAHLDTVGVEGMENPFSAAVRDGCLYGRGAYDMKNGFAACLGAVKALRDAGVRLRGDLFIAGVADEEVASLGMMDLLHHVHPDTAIVTEPTELALCLAHKGFAWIEIEVRGRAAHGSRFDLGVDANIAMGRVLAAVGDLEGEVRARRPHPLVGPPSLHVGLLRGGSGESTYAERAVATIERRMLPGESLDAVLAEIRATAERAAPGGVATSVRLVLAREGFELSPDAGVARAVRAAATAVLGTPPAEVGVAYWMDAALLAGAGVETAVIGATGAGAHAAEEWVDLRSVAQLAEILGRAATAVCGTS